MCESGHFLSIYSDKPMIVTNYKVPDHLSLNPLYFGTIPDAISNIEAKNLINYGKPYEKAYPLWNDYENKGLKLNNSKFEQPWYKSIPTNYVSFTSKKKSDNLFS